MGKTSMGGSTWELKDSKYCTSKKLNYLGRFNKKKLFNLKAKSLRTLKIMKES